MDWYSWLLESSALDRTLAYEYSLLFSQNELEEVDIAHFDHEFLLSMGISVAKHRLEILKLAKKHRRHHRPARTVASLFTVIDKACNSLTRYVNDLVRHESKAVVVVPRPGGGQRRTASSLMTSRRLAMVKKGRLLITDAVCSGAKAVQLGRSPVSQSMSPMVLLASGKEGHEDGFHWVGYNDTDQMRWDSMFQDLKPT